MLIIWLIIVCGLIGMFISLASEGEGGVSYTASEIGQASLGAAIAGAIIGAVAGVLLSLFAVFNIGYKGLLATLFLGLIGAIGCAILFAGFTALVKSLTNLIGEKLARAIVGLFIGIVIGIILSLFFSPLGMQVMPEYLKFAEPLREGIIRGAKGIAEFRHCLYADPRCPFIVSWDEPNIQTIEEELSVEVEFDERKILPDNTINVLISLSVNNPELSELRIKPKCYLGKEKTEELDIEQMGSYSEGDEFVFGTTGEHGAHTTLRCVGDIPEAGDKNIYSEIVILELERPVKVEAPWPVWLGEKPHKGIVRSEMKFNAPYQIGLASNNDMPFKEGKKYDFQVVLKRKNEDSKLKYIEKILISFPEDVYVDCKHFEGLDHEIEFSDYSYETLKSLVQYDKELDKFIFPCSLYVVSAPEQAVMAPFKLESYYTVYSDYDTRVVKSF